VTAAMWSAALDALAAAILPEEQLVLQTTPSLLAALLREPVFAHLLDGPKPRIGKLAMYVQVCVSARADSGGSHTAPRPEVVSRSQLSCSHS
jgi:hypothetical protein